MSIISLTYPIFIIITAFLYFIIPKKFQWIVLLMASTVFYVSAGISCMGAILATIVSQYLLAARLDRMNCELESRLQESGLCGKEKAALKKAGADAKKKYVVLSVLINIGLLCFVKYTGVFFEDIQILAPLGISFYTFKSLGYVIDVYRGKEKAEKNIMAGLGTIINMAGILAGGLGGLLFGSRLEKRYQDTLLSANGICVLFLGISGCLQEMFTIADGKISSGKTMMMIGSFAIGGLIGEWMNIEMRMEQFGEWLKKKTKNDQDTGFVDGFVTASLTVCIGAMAVVGAIQDGILGDSSVLTAKAVLDLIIIFVMTAAMGKGCIFSAVPVGIFQGAITLMSRLLEPVMTEAALSNLSLTGSILIFCVGLNLIWGKKVKAANLLPAIVIAVIWAFLPQNG